jgi:NO-binding membrane sensor protein with MHYT domain
VRDMTGTLALLLTVAAGVLVGVTDVRSPEVQGPVGVLFAAAFFLAAWHPEGAWRRGLMLGLSVPLAHLVAHVTGHALPYTVENPVTTLLAIVPAMLGTVVGVGVSRLRQSSARRPAD